MLSRSSPPGPNMAAFEARLRTLGYVPDVNIVIDDCVVRPWDDDLSAVTIDLIRQAFDAVVTTGTGLGLAFKRATERVQADRPARQRTPVIMTTDDGDCVGAGLVDSLTRPGGNVTGLTSGFSDLAGKRLELLREALPEVSRVATLWNASLPDKELDRRNVQQTAAQLRIDLCEVPVRHVDDLPNAVRAAAKAGAEALLILGDALTFRRQKQIVSLADEHHLPVCDFVSAAVPAGMLMSYGPYMPALYARAAEYVDQVLQGSCPADLAMEGPTQFELAINLQTAERLGLALPESFVRHADIIVR
jgi:putative tryptophan/tyrosine transport system substrate-binding protein